VPAYLTESSNAGARSYAVAAASDKLVTYSISSNTNPILANWIDRIYEYLSKIVNVTFARAESNGEFMLSLEEANYRDLYNSDYLVNNTGLIRWSSVHNTKQYGGVDDQRILVKAIGNSLGLSRLNWAWEAAGNSGTYTTADTVMSQTPWDRGYDFGHTVFFREDDKNALKQIHGGKQITSTSGKVNHIQREKEDLLLGINGQIDVFYLVAKGMNFENKEAITYDPVTGWDWVNDYNIPTIANFNPYEGDRIHIDRRLYATTNPISPNTDLPETLTIQESKVKTSDYLDNVLIDFVFATTPELDAAAAYTRKNTIFNDAGKLMLNVNGEQPGNGPGPVPGNGQLLAFIDIVGARPFEFKADWLSLWDQSVEQDERGSNTKIDGTRIIQAQPGKSALEGGAESHTFLFNRKNEFGKKKLDTITNFNPQNGDKIGISQTAFEGISGISLKTVQSKKAAKREARSKHEFIYNIKQGILFFNENGRKSGWGEGGEFTKLLGSPDIGEADFVLV
jgi:hypothetical protein